MLPSCLAKVADEQNGQNHRDMRCLFFLWIKPSSKHRWSHQLLDESRKNCVLQRVLANPPTLRLVTVYLENIYVMDSVCLVI